MSWLSVLKNDLLAVFEKAASIDPAAASTATQDVNGAIAALESALPSLANAGVNYILSLIPSGSQYAGLADEIIDLVIAGLTSKKATPPA